MKTQTKATERSATHTPAPWIMHGPENGNNGREVIFSNWGEVARVAYIGQDFHSMEANARLIAAAPELLEACTALVNQLEFIAVNVPCDNTKEALVSISVGRAAITKAKGSK